MFATIGHTFELMKMSWNVLMKDRELIIFPILSGLGLLILGFAGLAAGVAESGNLIAFLVLILIAYFITTFFNAALVSAALERLRGGDPNVMSGLSHATKHIHHIFLWSVISAIVGTLFRVLRSQTDNFFVQMIYSMIEGVWEFMTFFVIPVMVSENARPYFLHQAIRQHHPADMGTPDHRILRLLHRLPHRHRWGCHPCNTCCSLSTRPPESSSASSSLASLSQPCRRSKASSKPPFTTSP